MISEVAVGEEDSDSLAHSDQSQSGDDDDKRG